jgi:acetoacetate decarboxylase
MRNPTRRLFLWSSAAGAAGAALGWRTAAADPVVIEEVDRAHSDAVWQRWQAMGIRRHAVMQVRYLTDPERIARALPPPLEPDGVPMVQIDFYQGMTAPGGEVPLDAGPTYAESDFNLAARYRGHRGLYEHTLFLPRDVGRIAGREKQGLHKKDGWVRIERQGDRVRATTTRRGMLINALETVITEEPANPLYWFRELGWGWFQYNYRLDPDWRKGPLARYPVQLWRNTSGAGVPAYDEGYPVGMPEQAFMDEHPEWIPQAGDVSRTVVHTGELSPLNPTCEFPVREVLGVSWHAAPSTAPTFARVPVPREGSAGPIAKPPPPPRMLEEIDAEPFLEWALDNQAFDRPITAGKVWVPVGWPERTTAFRLTPEELQRYRGREALELDPVRIIDLSLELDASLHWKILPPQCPPGADHRIRILALDVERSDLSTRPFVELWLMARCELAGAPAWYALSHIVSWDGEVLFGRETFGYPSRLGDPEMTFDGCRYDILGRRMHRTFLAADVPVMLEEPHPHQDAFEVVGIQLHRLLDPPCADLLAQPWKVEIHEARGVDVLHLDLQLPDEPGPGKVLRTDPWFELASARVVSGVTGVGTIRRFPGRLVADLPDFVNWVAERFDGGTPYTGEGATFVEPKAADWLQAVYRPRRSS